MIDTQFMLNNLIEYLVHRGVSKEEATKAIESAKQLGKLEAQNNISTEPFSNHRAIELFYPNHKKISAIKLIRHWFGLGLKEAKNFVELPKLYIPIKQESTFNSFCIIQAAVPAFCQEWKEIEGTYDLLF